MGSSVDRVDRGQWDDLGRSFQIEGPWGGMDEVQRQLAPVGSSMLG